MSALDGPLGLVRMPQTAADVTRARRHVLDVLGPIDGVTFPPSDRERDLYVAEGRTPPAR